MKVKYIKDVGDRLQVQKRLSMYFDQTLELVNVGRACEKT